MANIILEHEVLIHVRAVVISLGNLVVHLLAILVDVVDLVGEGLDVQRDLCEGVSKASHGWHMAIPSCKRHSRLIFQLYGLQSAEIGVVGQHW